MIGKCLMAIGITISVIGTVFTLWTVMTTQSKTAGTWGELADRHKQFPKEKRRVIIGCVLIALGGAAQIAGQFL